MEHTRLGDTGLRISRLALGCMSYGDPATEGAHRWALADDEAQPFFRQAIELGITFWDTANVYQAGTSEEVVPYSPQGKGRLARPWGEQSTRSAFREQRGQAVQELAPAALVLVGIALLLRIGPGQQLVAAFDHAKPGPFGIFGRQRELDEH